MMSLPALGQLVAMAVVGQDPVEFPGGWDRKPTKVPAVKDPDAEAAEEKRLRGAVAALAHLGEDHPLLGAPMEELGLFFASRKRFAEAEAMLRRALAIRERDRGPDHPDVAESLVRLATCRIMAKEKGAETALPMLRRALTILEKADTDGPDVARVLHLRAMAHMLRKEFDAAESDLTRALAIRERTAGPDSAEAASLLDDLGDFHAARAASTIVEDIEAEPGGRPGAERKSERAARKAEEFYRRALAIREKIPNPDDDGIAETLYNLGQLAVLRERPADGEPYLERWLKLQETAKAPPDEKQAKVYLMLSGASMERKDWAGADRRLSRVQEIVGKVHGPESEEVAMILSSRADVSLKAGRYDDAQMLLKHSLEIEASILGAEDPIVSETRTLMAGSYRAHAEDRRAPVLWNRLRALGKEASRRHGRHAIDVLIGGYEHLLRSTNRVVPKPTEEDLAYLRKAGGAIFAMRPDDLTTESDIYTHDLDDRGLAHIARMCGLERLNLGGSWIHGKRITDAGLAHLEDLINLKHLDLAGADLTDAGLAHLARLENLEELNLMGTRVTAAGLVHLKGLKKLRNLGLAFTDVTDASLGTLQVFQGLRSLDLMYTRVTAAAVERLRRARPDLRIEHETGPDYLRPEPPPRVAPAPPPSRRALYPRRRPRSPAGRDRRPRSAGPTGPAPRPGLRRWLTINPTRRIFPPENRRDEPGSHR